MYVLYVLETFYICFDKEKDNIELHDFKIETDEWHMDEHIFRITFFFFFDNLHIYLIKITLKMTFILFCQMNWIAQSSATFISKVEYFVRYSYHIFLCTQIGTEIQTKIANNKIFICRPQTIRLCVCVFVCVSMCVLI